MRGILHGAFTVKKQEHILLRFKVRLNDTQADEEKHATRPCRRSKNGKQQLLRTFALHPLPTNFLLNLICVISKEQTLA